MISFNISISLSNFQENQTTTTLDRTMLDSVIAHPRPILVEPVLLSWSRINQAYYSRIISDEFFFEAINNHWIQNKIIHRLSEKNVEIKDFLLTVYGENNDVKDLVEIDKYAKVHEMIYQLMEGGTDFDPGLFSAIADHVMMTAALTKTLAWDMAYMLFANDDSVVDHVSPEKWVGKSDETMSYKKHFDVFCYSNVVSVRKGIKFLIKVHPEFGDITDNTGYTIAHNMGAHNFIAVCIKQLVRSFIRNFTAKEFFRMGTNQICSTGNFHQSVVGLIESEYMVSMTGSNICSPDGGEIGLGETVNYVRKNVKEFLNICAGQDIGVHMDEMIESLVDLSAGPHASATGYFKSKVEGGEFTGKFKHGDDITDLTPEDRSIKNGSPVGRFTIEQAARDGQLDNLHTEHDETTGGDDIYCLVDTTGSTMSSFDYETPPLMYILDSISMCLAEAARQAKRTINFFYYDIGISKVVKIPPDLDDQEFEAKKFDLYNNARQMGNDESWAFDMMFFELNMLEPGKRKTIIHFTDGGMLTDYARTGEEVITRNRIAEADALNASLRYQSEHNQTDVVAVLFNDSEPDMIMKHTFAGFPIVHIASSEDLQSSVIDKLIERIDPEAVTESAIAEAEDINANLWEMFE